MRSEITGVRLASPDVAEFRGVARRLEADRQPEQAIEEWRRICVLRPEGATEQLQLIQACRRLGHLDDASTAAQKAGLVLPKNARILLEQGEVALARGQGPEAGGLAP